MLNQETLNNYSWITSSDGKSIRPENPHKEKLGYYPVQELNPKWQTFESDTKDLTFPCEGLKPGVVYRPNELRIVWQDKNILCSEWLDANKSLYSSFENFQLKMNIQCRDYRICIKLAEGKQSDHIADGGKMIEEKQQLTDTNVGQSTVEAAEQAARLESQILDDNQTMLLAVEEYIGKNILYSDLDIFKAGAKWQLQNINLDEILELIASRAKTDPNWMNCIVDKQSILDCKEDIIKLLGK
jgi:hypothetical protein